MLKLRPDEQGQHQQRQLPQGQHQQRQLPQGQHQHGQFQQRQQQHGQGQHQQVQHQQGQHQQRQHLLYTKLKKIEDMEQCLEVRGMECSRKHKQLLELDQQLASLKIELDKKVIDLNVQEELIDFVAKGHDPYELLLRRQTSEQKVKKLTSDMYRVQEKLANALHQLTLKERTILSLNKKIDLVKESGDRQSTESTKQRGNLDKQSEEGSNQEQANPDKKSSLLQPLTPKSTKPLRRRFTTIIGPSPEGHLATLKEGKCEVEVELSSSAGKRFLRRSQSVPATRLPTVLENDDQPDSKTCLIQ